MKAVLPRFIDKELASSHVLSFLESSLIFCSNLVKQLSEKIKQVLSA